MNSRSLGASAWFITFTQTQISKNYIYQLIHICRAYLDGVIANGSCAFLHAG